MLDDLVDPIGDEATKRIKTSHLEQAGPYSMPEVKHSIHIC